MSFSDDKGLEFGLISSVLPDRKVRILSAGYAGSVRVPEQSIA